MGFIEKAGSAFHSQLSAGCQIQLIFIGQSSKILKIKKKFLLINNLICKFVNFFKKILIINKFFKKFFLIIFFNFFNNFFFNFKNFKNSSFKVWMNQIQI